MQNWVKRDIKEMIGSPQKGKKYSIEQAALLFIVEDLKQHLILNLFVSYYALS